MSRTIFRAAAVALAAFPLIMTAPGCGGGEPPATSPHVDANSDEGRKAIAEDEALRNERREQEAKASKRVRGGLPSEG